ncbi:ribosomal protein S7 [Lentinus tigrinus ALCF2SS1-7]|uniref:Ribosomal protein S7 n=1 Tax=Lentinus tigrinus ALCF2SS1-6 TaxID=1328759 RepID=A0A5C2S455_9APHY|nr:ribosomal protein S7 [Lentinus tigrinus ALCF2SS1-6]RPD72885.1 ribosomal protein S7 [Lentinus tigrinus ALCF2SS1-7]
MFASFRSAATRFAFRPPVAVHARRLATESTPSSLPGAENAVLSTLKLPTSTPAAANASTSTSTSVLPLAAAEPTAIHIPPAEDPLLHLFTSMLMRHGKRQQASRVTTKMLLHIHAFTQAPPLPILRQAVVAAGPLLRCRQFKRAAKQFVFPNPLSERQRAWQAVKWIVEESRRRRGGRHDAERLAREVVGIVRGDSEVLKKKEAVHKLAVLHRGNVVRPPRVPKSNRG